MRPVDMEDEAQKWLNSRGFNAAAVPLPEDFAERLPFALVTRTGGDTRHVAADQHALSVDVYADDWSTANSAACDAVALLREIDGAYVGGVCFYDVECGMPYTNPDPMNEYTPRMTFTVMATTSGKE